MHDSSPPAFPSKMTANDQSISLQDDPVRHEGMTLRDYFAAKALCGLVAEPATEVRSTTIVVNVASGWDPSGADAQQAFAHAAYVLADAMLAERAK